MFAMKRNVRIFTGRSNPELAAKICQSKSLIGMGGSPDKATVGQFPDGETSVKIDDDVRGRDCFVIQSSSPPANENFMELFIMIDSLKRASASRITAVMPYFGYARQDRKSEGRTPISSRMVANLLKEAGADRMLTVDLHTEQVEGFFDIPVDHLRAKKILVEYIRMMKIPDLVIVSPDVGNVKIASRYASDLGCELAITVKNRSPATGTVTTTQIIGDVKGKNVFLVDDMISTAGTVAASAKLVKDNGAVSVRVAATHGLFVGSAVPKLTDAGIADIIVTDTVPLNDAAKHMPNIKVASVSEVLGEAIWRISENLSVSAMFVNT